MDWQAGLRLTIAETGGVLTVRADPDGTCAVTGQGHLRLPAVLRHRCALVAGDRVLLAADPTQSRLTVYPPPHWTKPLPSPPTPAGGEPA